MLESSSHWKLMAFDASPFASDASVKEDNPESPEDPRMMNLVTYQLPGIYPANFISKKRLHYSLHTKRLSRWRLPEPPPKKTPPRRPARRPPKRRKLLRGRRRGKGHVT